MVATGLALVEDDSAGIFDIVTHDAERRYRQFGFEERYVYWYRGRPGEQG